MKKILFTIQLCCTCALGFTQDKDRIQKDSFKLSEMQQLFMPYFPAALLLHSDSSLLMNGNPHSLFSKVLKIKELKARYEETQIRIADAYTQYEWREDITIEPNTKNEKVKCVPARYDTIFEKIEIKPITFKFVKRNVRKAILGVEMDVRMMQCFKRVEIPSDSMIICHYVLAEPPKMIRKSRGKILEEVISIHSDSLNRIFVPAKYQIVHQMVAPNDFLIATQDTIPYYYKGLWVNKKQGVFSLRPIPYCVPVSEIRIHLLQTALKKRGYYNGNVDNVFSEQTQKAIFRFQKEHGLKINQLDWEIWRVLGVNSKQESDLHDEKDSDISSKEE